MKKRRRKRLVAPDSSSLRFDLPALTLGSAPKFVRSWSRLYRKKWDVAYEENIRRGQTLTEANVEALMKWKATQGKKAALEAAKRVGLDKLNSARTSPFSVPALQAFYDNTASLATASGVVYRVMLCHIAWPSEVPIYDVNAWTAWRRIAGMLTSQDLSAAATASFNEYLRFRRFVVQLSGTARPEFERQVDHALFCFGRFLRSDMSPGRQLIEEEVPKGTH